METKKWYESKTIWASIIAIIVGCYNVFLSEGGALGIHLPKIPDAIFPVLGFFGVWGRATANTTIN